MNPIASNIIIFAVLAGIIILAVRSTIKRLKGESSCCGGGGIRLIKRQKISHVIAVRNMHVEGMVCENCAGRIHNVLNSIDGINAKVIRSRNQVIVKLGKDIDDGVIRKAVEDLGYRVIEIK